MAAYLHGIQQQKKAIFISSKSKAWGILSESALPKLQGFAESLQHCIKLQISVTSLYGSFSTLNLPYKEVT